MYLRIIRPVPATLEGFDVRRFQLLGLYEVQTPLCDLLVLDGYAIPEAETPPSREAAIKAIAGAIVPEKSPTISAVTQGQAPVRTRRRKILARKRR